MVLVHEADPSHGGAPLDVLRADCVASGRDAEKLFAHPIVRWQRIQDFHVLSLRLIAAHVLHTMPQFRASPTPPPVYVPGEISKQRFTFKAPVELYVSAANPGAAALAEELCAKYKVRPHRSHCTAKPQQSRHSPLTPSLHLPVVRLPASRYCTRSPILAKSAEETRQRALPSSAKAGRQARR